MNPFYVEPAGNYQQALSGLGNVIGNYREERKRLDRSEAAKLAATDAYKSGDPEKVAAAAIEYPEIQQTLQSLYGFKNEQTKRNAMETYKEVLSNKDNPAAALDAINARISFVESQGGDPSTVTLRARDRLQSMMQAGQDTGPFFKSAELEYAGIASPQEWKAYSGASQEDAPSSVKETEWFLKQSPKVQEEHLKLKRKTDPTMAEKLIYAQEISNIKINEGKEKTQAAQDIKLATEPEIVKAKQMAVDAAKRLNKQQGQMSKLEDADRIYKSLGNTDLDIIYGRGEKWYPEVFRSQKGVDLMAQRDQLVGMLNLAARGELQGQGSITEGEGAAVLAAATTLANPNVSPSEARKALDLAMKKIYGGAGKSFTMGSIQDGTQKASGKSGGTLMIDANGNRAIVYPDGTFEEQ